MDQSMTSISEAISSIKIRELDDECDKHNIKLVEFSGKAICPACAEETTLKSNEAIVKQRTDNYYKRDRHYIKQSIYSDGTLKVATFDTYQTDDEETTTNKKKARTLAGQYLKGSTFNVVFTGKVGTGKSHLAKSMLEAVNEHSDPYRKCLFVSVDELISLLRYSYGNREGLNENQLRNLCVDADLLVLDDLGAEVGAIKTEKSASNDTVRIINAIVTGRMDKPTIFTTNLSSRQISAMYDQRIASRILKGVNKDRIIKFSETKDKRNQIEF